MIKVQGSPIGELGSGLTISTECAGAGYLASLGINFTASEMRIFTLLPDRATMRTKSENAFYTCLLAQCLALSQVFSKLLTH